MDLISGVAIAQISHESKIDWLELNETAHKLLFRDRKQRLAKHLEEFKRALAILFFRLLLVDVGTSEKHCIFSGVSFVQWVVESDVAVAQAGNTLAVWYNIDVPEYPTIINVQGEVVDIVRKNGKTEAITVDGHNSNSVELDEGLVEFGKNFLILINCNCCNCYPPGTAIHDTDYGRAVLFLENITDTVEAEAMWHNLSSIALKQHNLALAERCYAALGDVAAAHYLHETLKIGEKYAEDHNDSPSNCTEVWVRLAIFSGDLSAAENIYLEQGNIEGALEMYKTLHKWDDAIR